MEVRYRTKKLSKICTNADVARRAYGHEMAIKIQMRIDQITAAETVEVLLKGNIGHCHLLIGNRKNEYAMALVQPYRLVFIKKGEEIQIAEIQEIVDYHK